VQKTDIVIYSARLRPSHGDAQCAPTNTRSGHASSRIHSTINTTPLLDRIFAAALRLQRMASIAKQWRAGR
jgi:hypothetical protein